MQTNPSFNTSSMQLSHALVQKIAEAIFDHGGFIPFDQFMAQALYTQDLGYYTAKNKIFGPQGDFITAPLISPLFSRCVARALIAYKAEFANLNILEIGAGNGQMTRDILLYLDSQNQLPQKYFILDISPNLQAQQAETFKGLPQNLAQKICWVDEIPDAFNGIILANEMLDALPCKLFVNTAQGIVEKCVSVNAQRDCGYNEKFLYTHHAVKDLTLLAKLQNYIDEFQLPIDYTLEVNIAAQQWIAQLAKKLQKGLVLLLDYGYERKALYHPDRTQGTLMCFSQHQKHDNPLINVGLQDITTHVDFTAIAEVAVDNGMQVSGFTSQGSFLLSCGLLSLPEIDADPFHIAVKKLTLPSEMGEIIKVMALTKNLSSDAPLIGFNIEDRRRHL